MFRVQSPLPAVAAARAAARSALAALAAALAAAALAAAAAALAAAPAALALAARDELPRVLGEARLRLDGNHVVCADHQAGP